MNRSELDGARAGPPSSVRTSHPKAPMLSTKRLRDCGNDLLDRLPADEFDPLKAILQRVSLENKQVVQQFESNVTHVYFPTTALFSLMSVLLDEDPVEVATVGRRGLVGLTSSLGIDKSPHRVICQMSGDSLCLPVHPFREALRTGRELPRTIERYLAFSLQNASQGIACNARHSIEKRASRWLLITHDQAGRDEFTLTQEFWASMLGVRRAGVTVVAGALQKAGLIAYHRGVITVLDRSRLEEAACECYTTSRDYYERILS